MTLNINKKSLIIGAAILLLCLILFFFFVLRGDNKGTCMIENKIAARGLLEPMIADRTDIAFETGVKCKILKRIKQNSIVLYKSPRGPDPITLKVAALPKDKISVSDKNVLLVNGVEYLNSKGEIYRLSAPDQKKIMATIAEDHKGKMPKGFYFLMGDNDSIYLDSSRFGLADGKDILGIRSQE